MIGVLAKSSTQNGAQTLLQVVGIAFVVALVVGMFYLWGVMIVGALREWRSALITFAIVGGITSVIAAAAQPSPKVALIWGLVVGLIVAFIVAFLFAYD